MEAAGVEYGHDECCGGTSVLAVPERRPQGGGQSRLVSVGCWVFARELCVSLVGLQGSPLVMGNSPGCLGLTKFLSPSLLHALISCDDDDDKP